MIRRRVAALVVVGTLAVALVGCGGGDDGKSAGRDGSRDGTSSNGDTGSATAYEGLGKKVAIAKADAAGITWRITREDDETFLVTMDYDPERLNFEIDDGTVTKASYG